MKAAAPTSDTPAPSVDLQELITQFMPFLREVQRRLLWVAVVFITATVAGFIKSDAIVNFFLHFYELEGVNIVFTSPFQFFNLALSTAIVTGITLVLPLLLYQIVSFLKPALSDEEFAFVVKLAPVAIFLFVLGTAFGAYIMKYVISLFYERSVDLQIGNILDISQLLSQILITACLMGVSFQFPIVLTALIRFDIVPYQTFASQRVIAYAVSILFAALLPPTDILSLALLTLPLVFLFELTLLFNRSFKHKPATKRLTSK